MSFPKYPKYKDSGVEWLMKLPDHWNAAPLKCVGRLKGGAGFPHDHQGQEGEELCFHKVNALSQADNKGYLTHGENTISREIAQQLGAFVFPPNTIVFAKVGAALLLGRIRLLRSNACVDNNMMGLVITEDGFDASFVRYGMSLVRFDLIANPGAVPSLNEGQIGSFRMPFPPLPEQTLIARFLDAETSKIDSLIAEQRRLIESLKEKRQAVISHAVTKGLNPNAPMKPSGIEWAGPIPNQWSTPPVFARYQAVLGKMLDENKLTGEHPIGYLRNADVNWDTINVEDLPVFDIKPDEFERFTVVPGDILICEGGAGIGQTAIWKGELERCAFQKALHRLRPWSLDRENPRYFYYCMRFIVETGVVLAGGTATIPHLTGEQLRKYRFPRPPIEEQDEIVEFLDEIIGQFAALEVEATHAIDLLQERRTALISAAVTGKIDVREFAPVSGKALAAGAFSQQPVRTKHDTK